MSDRRAAAAPTLVLHRSPEALAEAVAARLVTVLVEAQAAQGRADLVLTGGRIGTGVLTALSVGQSRDAVDRSRLHMWWGDERFLAAGDPDRNDTAALAAAGEWLAGCVLHRVAGPDTVATPELSAAAYAAELSADVLGPTPAFDVLLLSIGEDGHIASLFPGYPALHEERMVTAVHGSPKPPPLRVTLTLPAIRRARQVWLLATGESKAEPLRDALSGEAGLLQAPAVAAEGSAATTWFADDAAAQLLPPSLARFSSP